MLRKLLPVTFNRVLLHKFPSHSVSSLSCLYSQDVPSVPSGPRADLVFMALRSAQSVGDILKVIGIHAAHMEPEHVTQSMKMLCSLRKSANALRKESFSEVDVLNSEEFLHLCRRLKTHLPVLEVNDILDALKTVTYFGVPHNSEITMKLLHLIKRDINELSIGQIVFLSFLLRQYPRNSVIDALKIALPIVFEAQLKTKLDRSNVSNLVNALTYCSKNNISREVTDYVLEALCGLDQLDWVTMDPQRACNIALALCNLSITNAPPYRTAFLDAIDVVVQNLDKASFNTIDSILSASLRNYKRAPYLFHLPLFEKAGELAASKDWPMRECSLILRKISSVGVVNKKLLDNMADKILEDPEGFRQGRFSLVKTFVSGMSVANYKTHHWNLLKDLLPTSAIFQNIQPKEPWMQLCLELASLDLFSDSLLSQVFSPWFLESYLAREYNKLDLLQLLHLHQVVSVLHPAYKGPTPPKRYLEEAEKLNSGYVTGLPLRGALELAMGPRAVLSRCRSSLGHFIDHVVVLQPDGDPVLFPDEYSSQSFTYLDQLTVPSNCIRVAVFLSPPSHFNTLNQFRGIWFLNHRVLEAIGYAVVNVAAEAWSAMPDWEKTPYLLQKIQLKASHASQKEIAGE